MILRDIPSRLFAMDPYLMELRLQSSAMNCKVGLALDCQSLSFASLAQDNPSRSPHSHRNSLRVKYIYSMSYSDRGRLFP